MRKLGLKELPYRRTSHFTPEVVAEIKAVPDGMIEYSDKELELMARAEGNLVFMIEDATQHNLDKDDMEEMLLGIRGTLESIGRVHSCTEG